MKAVGLEPTTYGLKELADIDESDGKHRTSSTLPPPPTAETSAIVPSDGLISAWSRLSEPIRDRIVDLIRSELMAQLEALENRAKK
jgi:hypothetical protein